MAQDINTDFLETPDKESYLTEELGDEWETVQEPVEDNGYIANILKGAGQTVENLGRVYPALETAATLVTSAYGIPLSGFAGIAALPWGADTAAKVVEKAQQLMVYQPQTKRGEEFTAGTFYPFEKLGEAAHWTGEKTYEATDSALLASLVESGIMAAPAALPFLKSIKARALTKPQVSEVTKRIKNIKKNNPNITESNLRKAIEDIVDDAENKYWGLKDTDKTTVNRIQQKLDRKITDSTDQISFLEEEIASLKKDLLREAGETSIKTMDPFSTDPFLNTVTSSDKIISEIKTKMAKNPLDPSINFDLNILEVETIKMARMVAGKEPLENIIPIKAQRNILSAETIKMKIKSLEEQGANKAIIDAHYRDLNRFQKIANVELTKFFKKEKARELNIEKKLWFASGKKPPKKPPVFKSTQEALAWAEKASLDDIPILEKIMEDHYAKGREFRKVGKHNESTMEVGKGGFYREAVEKIRGEFPDPFARAKGMSQAEINIRVKKLKKSVEKIERQPLEDMDITLTHEDAFIKAASEQLNWWEGIKKKTKEISISFKHKILREYEHLPHTPEFARVRKELLLLEKQRDITLEKTYTRIKYMVEDVIDKPKDYEAFVKKVVLDDLYDDAIKKAKRDPELPFEYENLAELKKDYEKISKYTDMSEEVSLALTKRKALWNSLRDNYVEAMDSIGYDVSGRFTSRPNYYRHIVLDYAEAEGIKIGTGKKLKAPTKRPYMWHRKGSKKDYSTDFAAVESEVMAKMMHDIEIAKVIKFIEDNYDKRASIIANTKFPLGSDAEIAWRDYMPEGHVTWQPRDGNIFHVVDAISGAVAEKLMVGTFENLGIQPKHIRKVLAKEGRFKELVIPEALAKTLDNLTKEKRTGIYKKGIVTWKKDQLMNPKRLIKYNLRNLTGDADAVFAGNPAAFKKVPKAFDDLWDYYRGRKKLADLPELKDWIERGGTQTTLQAQEMGALNRLNKHLVKNRLKLKEGKIIKAGDKFRNGWNYYWDKAYRYTDLRESLLRYANYLEYLDQMKKPGISIKNAEVILHTNIKTWLGKKGIKVSKDDISMKYAQEKGISEHPVYGRFYKNAEIEAGLTKHYTKKYLKKTENQIADIVTERIAKERLNIKVEGTPDNFGASRRAEVMALETIEDRAFWLSNDLLGAYDKVSVAGKSLRENLIPFWSWKEVNMKRYGRLVANAAEDGHLTSSLMRKVPGMTLRMAKFGVKASALWAMMTLWNNLRYGELEAKLPEHVRNTPHIITGYDEETGEVNYINRLGAVGDALEWFGMDTPSAWINDYFHRGKGLKEIAKETITEMPKKAFKGTVNNFVNGLNPVVKILGESITRRSLFPDVFSPRTIRDRAEHITSIDPIAQDVYNYLIWRRKPAPFRSDKYGTKAESIVQYLKSWGTSSMDIEAGAYSETLNMKRKFMQSIGKGAEGFWLTETGKALYNAKLAYRYKDSSEFDRWMQVYFDRGGTMDGLKRSIKRMHPLSNMNKEQTQLFYESLNEEERDIVVKSLVFYDDLSRGIQPQEEGVEKEVYTTEELGDEWETVQ